MLILMTSFLVCNHGCFFDEIRVEVKGRGEKELGIGLIGFKN